MIKQLLNDAAQNIKHRLFGATPPAWNAPEELRPQNCGQTHQANQVESLLGDINCILGLSQDIQDCLDETSMTEAEKLQLIHERNDKIVQLCSEILPG